MALRAGRSCVAGGGYRGEFWPFEPCAARSRRGLGRGGQEVSVVLEAGYYCVGASMLQPVYNSHAPVRALL